MYNKSELLTKLAETNCYIDIHTLESFLRTWRLEPVFEDPQKGDCFDDISLGKLLKGIELKAEGLSSEQILAVLSEKKPEESRPETVVKQVIPRWEKDEHEDILAKRDVYISEEYESAVPIPDFESVVTSAPVEEEAAEEADFTAVRAPLVEADLPVGENVVVNLSTQGIDRLAKIILEKLDNDKRVQKLSLENVRLHEEKEELNRRINLLMLDNNRLKKTIEELDMELDLYSPTFAGLYRKKSPK